MMRICFILITTAAVAFASVIPWAKITNQNGSGIIYQNSDDMANSGIIQNIDKNDVVPDYRDEISSQADDNSEKMPENQSQNIVNNERYNASEEEAGNSNTDTNSLDFSEAQDNPRNRPVNNVTNDNEADAQASDSIGEVSGTIKRL